MGGQVMPPIVYQQEGSFKDRIIDMLPGGLSDYIRYGTNDGEASDVAYGTVPLENAKPTLKHQFNPFQNDQLETKERPSIEPTFNSLNLGEGKTLQKIRDAGSLEKYIEKQEKFNKLNAKIGKITPPVQSVKPEAVEITPPVQSDVPKTVEKNEPVKVDTSGMYPENPDVADNELGSDKESLTQMSQARAVNTEKKVVSDIAKQVQEQSGNDGITTLRKALETYNKDIRSFIDKDPYRQQKFWLTVSAAIMQPGNAFANMAKGFKQAIDGLDASDKKKNELLMGLLGKKFDTEVAVSGIQEKRSSSLKDRIKDLNIAISKASGEVRKELLKQRAKIVAADRNTRSRRSTKILEMDNSEILAMIKNRYNNLSEDKRDILNERLSKFGGGSSWYTIGGNANKVGNFVKDKIASGINFDEILGL
tara:strand:- start:14 stop:1276 length:1263 start_codon:yes stop_codon:yes gene_type:complete